MPFQARLDKGAKVQIPEEFVKGMNLKEGDFVTLDIVPLMGQKGYRQLETELGMAQEYEIAMNTLHHYIPTWMANFKANLPLFVRDAKSFSDIVPAEGRKRQCVIVANGPSIYQTDLAPLSRFGGTIITTNKPLKHLLESNIIPDWVTALDADEVVLKSFDHDIVREMLPKVPGGVLLPTTVHPKVAQFCADVIGKDKIYWSNPHFSDAIAPNICETLTSITNVPSCEHGGNVGTFSYQMSIRPLYCTPIGLFGFDLSFRPDPKWPLEYVTNYRFFYNPLKDETYAMPPAFEYYMSRLMDLWEQSRKLTARTVNLTPVGPLNAVIGITSATLEEFCYDEEL